MSSITGPIVLIEDDEDDQEILKQIFAELKVTNKLKFFENCPDALNYLMDTKDNPFIIISDINLPGMSGIDMRKKINDSDLLRKKSIPFIFLSTATKMPDVELAYEMMVQGFFEKPNTTGALKDFMDMILKYWRFCKHPNSVRGYSF